MTPPKDKKKPLTTKPQTIASTAQHAPKASTSRSQPNLSSEANEEHAPREEAGRTSPFTSPNPFQPLQGIPSDDMETTQAAPRIARPPPIFVRDITNFGLMCSQLDARVGRNSYTCIPRHRDTKIVPNCSDTYREIIKYLQETKAQHHTYQLKEERSLRVVIRNLHHTTPTEAITEELTELGFEVKNVTNVTSTRGSIDGRTQKPLPLFFVDLTPTSNMSEIYKLQTLYHCRIRVEKPHPSRDVLQCHRCQEYGHSKTRCGYTPRCVKCGQAHASAECTKPRSTPAVCALCHQSHPANYKGCEVYQNLKQRIKPSRGQPTPRALPPSKLAQPEFSYAQTTRGRPAQAEPTQQQLPHQAQPTHDCPPLPQGQPIQSHPPTPLQPSPPRAERPSISNIPPPPSTNDLSSMFQTFLSEMRSLITPLLESLFQTLLTAVISRFSLTAP